MTTTIAENANRDMYTDSTGNIAFVTSLLATAQLCKSAIEAQRGEMKYAADQGMPMFDTAFNQYNPKQFEAAARTIILAQVNVTGIQSFTMFLDDNDNLQYTAVIETIFGTTTVSSQ